MAGERRPDGVQLKPGEFVGEPDQGPALSRSQVPVTAITSTTKTGESFPSGLKALEGKDDAATVKIVNLSMKRVRFDRTGPGVPGKKSVVQQVLKPFETYECTVAEARRLLKNQEAASARVRPMPVLAVVGAFTGDCGGKRTFRVGNRTYDGCPFHGCSYRDHSDRPWSVRQGLLYMRMLKTPGAIDRFVNEFDTRDAVVQLAHLESQMREEAHRREQQAGAKGLAQTEAVI
jgi:hypothetical protein